MMYRYSSYIYYFFFMIHTLIAPLSSAEPILGNPTIHEEKELIINGDQIIQANVIKNYRAFEIDSLPYLDIKMLPTELTNAKYFGRALLNTTLTRNCNEVETGNDAAFKISIVNNNNHTIPIKYRAPWMPENPGKMSKNTIIGIDKDRDCVRDDIERYIGKKYPRKDQQIQRKYLFEYAKWLGIFLQRDNWSAENIRSISNNIRKTAECVRRIHGAKGKTSKLLDDIFAEFHNTFPRSFRYIKNRGLLGGWAPRKRLSVSCS